LGGDERQTWNLHLFVVAAASPAKKVRAAELILADFFSENRVALAAAQIVAGFPYHNNVSDKKKSIAL
jgi:hypothetical protein